MPEPWELRGGPLDGVRCPWNPVNTTAKEWLLVKGVKTAQGAIQIKQGQGRYEEPEKIPAGCYLYRRSADDNGKVIYTFVR